MSKLRVALTSDTEDNHPAYVPGWNSIGSNYDVKPAILRWEWSQYLGDLSDFFRSKDAPVTWLVRVDDGPMKDRMLEILRNEILELKNCGDEIGIHIHTLDWDQRTSKWAQTKDPKREAEIVLRSLEMFREKLGFSPSSVRMGWCAMSNDIMRTLDASGLIVDSSALSGSFCSGKFGRRDNIYDWSRAPCVHYHPSYDDYQSSGNMKILEIPISGLEGGKSNVFAGLVNRFSEMKGLTRLLPAARWLNLTPHSHFYISPWWSPSIYDKIIEAYGTKARTNGKATLVGSFHACDILDPITGNKNVTFVKYFSTIFEKISSLRGIDVAFMTLSEMAREILERKLTT